MIKAIECEDCTTFAEFEATETYTDGFYAEYEAECPDHGVLSQSVNFEDCHGE